jgi:hypothetical protein
MKQFNVSLASAKAVCQNRGLILFALRGSGHSLVAIAQITTATIVGTITDPVGQVWLVPVSPATSIPGSRAVTSGDDGSYRLEFLPVGNYVVR